MNELILGSDAQVGSVVLRKPGASRGVRLIHLESLLEFLDHTMMEQRSHSANGKEVTENE